MRHVLLIACFSLATQATAGDAAADLKASLDSLVPGLLEEHNVPAAGIALADRSGLVFDATYGNARPGVAADEKTLFNVASVTKLLAAETILQLAATGRFNLDQPMAPTYVDPDVAEDARSQLLTPRHALPHQTGFPNWRSTLDGNKLAFQFEPGSRAGYSGEGYEYVARFAEAVTGTPFPELVAEMTGLEVAQDRIAFNTNTPHADDFAWSRNGAGAFAPAATQSHWSAADDLYASPAAFAGFLGTLLGGSLPSGLETDRRTIQLDMTTPFCGRPHFAAICPKAIGFGLSGIVFRYEDDTVLWQGGGDVGERAIALLVPEKDLALVIFTNGSNGARLFAPVVARVYDNPAFVDFLRLQGQQE